MTVNPKDLRIQTPPCVRLCEAQPRIAVLGLFQSHEHPDPRSTPLPTRPICRGDITGQNCLWLSTGLNQRGAPEGVQRDRRGQGLCLLLIPPAFPLRGGLGPVVSLD